MPLYLLRPGLDRLFFYPVLRFVFLYFVSLAVSYTHLDVYKRQDKSIALFTKHAVFTEAEIRSRYEILMENYTKVLSIEALSMIEMVRRDILPAGAAYGRELAAAVLTKREVSDKLSTDYEEKTAARVSALTCCINKKCEQLESALCQAKEYTDVTACGVYFKDEVFTAMQELRAVEMCIRDRYKPRRRPGQWP